MQYYQPNVGVHYTDCILQNDKSTSTFYLNTKSNSQVFIWCFPIFCFSTSFWVMVTALGSWLRGSSLRIGRVILSSSWERHFVLTVHPPRREARYGYRQIIRKAWRNVGRLPCVGLTSHPEGSSNTVSRHRNQDKLWLGGSRNSNTDLTNLCQVVTTWKHDDFECHAFYLNYNYANFQTSYG